MAAKVTKVVGLYNPADYFSFKNNPTAIYTRYMGQRGGREEGAPISLPHETPFPHIHAFLMICYISDMFLRVHKNTIDNYI